MFSPPYHGQKDYGVDGQMGAEDTTGDYLDAIAGLMAEIERVLKPSGQVYLNIGDRYDNKSKVLLPERVAMRLKDDGWYVRQKITWEKTNPLPDNATDRRSTVTEQVLHLTPTRSYFWDHEEAKVPAQIGGDRGVKRNPKNTVRTATASYSGDHTAAYPVDLCAEFLPQACPEYVCGDCGEPYEPSVREEQLESIRDRSVDRGEDYDNTDWNNNRSSWVGSPSRSWKSGWQQQCGCDSGREPGVVLDPMCGTGSTMVAAERLERRWVGIELDPDTASEAADRTGARVIDP